jgi:hypothetical protein
MRNILQEYKNMNILRVIYDDGCEARQPRYLVTLTAG